MGNSTIIERWWLVTFASFIVVFLLFLNHSPGSNNISLLQNVTVPINTASNGFPMPNMQSPIVIEDEKIRPCIPLTETPSSQVPFAALQDAKPATGSFQTPAGSTWQNVNLNPSDFTQKVEPEPALPDSVKQAITLNDEIEAGTESSSPVPVVEGKNQEQSRDNVDDEEPATMEEGKNCNIFEGKWIYDPIESPLYDSAMCPFFSDTTSCRRNGRPDKQYEKWRWEANDCKIPRFNAKDMLERLRGKRVVIVGDSINHSQFESLSCLLYSAIPDQSYVDARYQVFKAESYDLVIEFHWAQFLVEVVVNKTEGKKTLKLDSVDPNSKKWKDADIMVFNTGHWWTNRLRWDLFQYKRNVFEDMKIETAFKVAMKTWARWVERNVDTSKTTVYFRGMSPAHFGKNWCYKSTKPYTDVPSDLKFGQTLKETVEKTLGRMKAPVKYLNITGLSAYRVDAHSSIYAKKDGQLLIATKQKPPAMVADCSHWCLPGVPDTWNHLLYASMVLDRSKGISNV